MTVIFYLDVYFLVNLAMDMMLLSMVRKILKLPRKKGRILLGGCGGALWACAMVYLPMLPGGIELIFTGVFGSAIMIILAFGTKRLLEFGKIMGTLWLVSAAAGGVLMAFGDHIRTGWYLVSSSPTAYYSTVSLLLGMIGVYFGICGCVAFVKGQIREGSHLYQVTLSYRDKKTVVTALLDTGNHLFEPYGHEPVHVITYKACRNLCETINRVVYIPFQAVGTKQGVLPGIRIDEMEVSQNGEVVMVLKKPWIAISREPLSSNHRYEMLLNGKKEE